MSKQTLMIFASKACQKSSKVSFQSVATEIEDLESGMERVSDKMDQGKLEHGKVFPLWGYVHVSADVSEDEDDWDIECSDDAPSNTESTESESQSTDTTEEDEDIPF